MSLGGLDWVANPAPIGLVLLGLALALLLLYLRGQGLFLSRHSLVFQAYMPIILGNPLEFFLRTSEKIPSERRISNLISNFLKVISAVILATTSLIAIRLFYTKIQDSLVIGILQSIDIMWQVHATLAGFSFVALLFYWETLSAKLTVPEAIGPLTDKTGVLGSVYTLLFSNFLIGAAVVWARIWLPATSSTEFPLIGYMEILSVSASAGVFILSFVVLLAYYEALFKNLFKKGIEEAVKDSFSSEMDIYFSESSRPPFHKYVSRIQSVEQPEYTFGVGFVEEGITAGDLDIADRTITDVHLDRLEKAVRRLELDENTVQVRLRPGIELKDHTRLVQFDSGIVDEESKTQFLDAFDSAIKTQQR